MVIDDREFGELVGEVRTMKDDIAELKTDVKTLLADRNQAQGAISVLKPFTNKVVSLIWTAAGIGFIAILIFSIIKFYPVLCQLQQILQKGGG